MWPVRRADNLTTFIYQVSWNLVASPSWKPQGLSRSLMRMFYLLPLTSNIRHYPNLKYFLSYVSYVVMAEVCFCGHAVRGVPRNFTLFFFRNVFDREDEGTTIFRNVKIYSTTCTFTLYQTTEWSKSLCAPDDCIVIIRCTETFRSPCTKFNNTAIQVFRSV
jgi:hypothetical protein